MAMPKMHLMITIEDENLNKKQKDTFKKDIRQKTKKNRMCPKSTSYLLFIIKVFYNLIKWFYHFYSQSESVDNTIEYSNTGNDDPVLNF